jgi:hypothetical protein
VEGQEGAVEVELMLMEGTVEMVAPDVVAVAEELVGLKVVPGEMEVMV